MLGFVLFKRRAPVSRREAREHVMKLLFQKEFIEEDEYEEQALRYLERYDVNENQYPFILGEYNGAIKYQEEIDHMIKTSSKNWKINRMAKLDLTIIRLAVYEIYYVKDIPTSVAINEAVELGKKYSSDEAPAFINGLLASVVKEVKE